MRNRFDLVMLSNASPTVGAIEDPGIAHFGQIDLRAQAEIASALRTDGPPSSRPGCRTRRGTPSHLRADETVPARCQSLSAGAGLDQTSALYWTSR